MDPPPEPLELSPAVRAFVEAQRVARLATVDPAGTPHIVPICFVLLGGRCYSVVDEKPKRSARLQRLRNIEEHGAATLLCDVYSDDWEQLAWAMLRCHAARYWTRAATGTRKPSLRCGRSTRSTARWRSTAIR